MWSSRTLASWFRSVTGFALQLHLSPTHCPRPQLWPPLMTLSRLQKVALRLLQYGPQTLPVIITFTELKYADVRNCLLVLMQHSCVVRKAMLGHADDFTYEASLDDILRRIRFPRILSKCQEKFKRTVRSRGHRSSALPLPPLSFSPPARHHLHLRCSAAAASTMMAPYTILTP